ncbi:MAG: hypothetical protein JXA64_11370, partial [Candidatus Fermentibacteraceae bacterium]|nr:hypothetical protein [Candidatus Fermentibacteraceae bacterium]
MTLLIMLCASLSQLLQPVQTDPAAGFTAFLSFPQPQRAEIESGAYPVFSGVPTRFVPGEPPRPAVTLFIPVPPGSEPHMESSASGWGPTGTASVSVRTPALSGGGLEATEVTAEPVAPPVEHAVLEGIIPLGGTRVAMITVYPVTDLDGASYASRISVSLSWEPAGGGIPVEDHPLLGLIAPEGCLYWKDGPDQPYESVFWGLPWARISVRETGGYSVTGDRLEAAGCQIIGSPCATLRMYTGPGVMFSSSPEDSHQLEEVGITVSDADGDGIFEGNDSVLFFGRGLSRWQLEEQDVFRLEHRYATHNVYWLTWGGENGRRMGTVSGEPDASPGWGSTIHTDTWMREESIWLPRYEISTGWVWQTISQGESISLPFQVGEQGSCSIRVSVITETSQLHVAALYVNGTEVLTDSWYGSGRRVLEVNDLQLSGSCDLDIVLVEDAGEGELALTSVQVDYPDLLGNLTGRVLFPSREKTGRYNFSVSDVSSSCCAYDLTDHYRPAAVSGGQYSSGSYRFSFIVDPSTELLVMDGQDWMSPDSVASASPGRLVGTVSQGDRLIVAHPSILDGTWGMQELLSQQGFSPVAATTSEIYDEFGQGVADPGAIRSAVRWAMDTWSPGLGGLILTGDGHYDFLGHNTAQPVMVPPWIILGTGREDSVDDIYVMVHQGAVLPEIPVSRIPVDNPSQLGTCTAKLLAYSQEGSSGDWTDRALIVADDEWGQGATWNETLHTVNSELIAEEVLPRWMSREKFYLVEYPWPPGPWTPEGPHPDKPEARESFLEALDMGYLFILYQGHGAGNQIAHEVLMMDQDVSGLQNGDRLPVSFWGTCDVGHFDNPGTDVIGETLVLHPAGGCISSVAATRGTYGESNYQFFRSVIDSLCHYPTLSVGTAVWQSKIAFSGSYSSNNRFYVVFGYPDMPLPMPESDGIVILEGDTLRSGELNTITGQGFPGQGLAFIKVLESSWNTVYTCLGGAQIPYLRSGGTAYSGTQTVEGGEFSIDCFIPLQSTTGNMSRAAAFSLSGEFSRAGAADPAVLVEGTPSGGDLQGPEVDMWIRGYEDIQYPQLTGNVTLEAQLTDSSGICLLGGSGKELNLFIDGSGNDVGSHFSYDRGSSVSGRLEYEMEALTEGDHTLILWSVDGLGNSSRDTLQLRILQDTDLA